MAAIQTTGRINEAGKLEIDVPEGLPPGTLVHVTVEPIDPDQAWFWTPEWQAAERKADEDIAAGRVKTFDTMDELLDDLFNDDETD